MFTEKELILIWKWAHSIVESIDDKGRPINPALTELWETANSIYEKCDDALDDGEE